MNSSLDCCVAGVPLPAMPALFTNPSIRPKWASAFSIRAARVLVHGHVAAHAERPGELALELGQQVGAPGGHHHLCALVGQAGRQHPPDARRRARNDHDTAGEVEQSS